MGAQVRDGEAASVTTERRKLPNDRQSVTHAFRVGEVKCFITVGLYEDDSVGEVFLQAGHGNASDDRITGLLDGWAVAFSLALQHGCPLESLLEKFERMRFEPAGLTSNPQIPMATSIFDYCARWLRARFLAGEHAAEVPAAPAAPPPAFERCRGDGTHGCGHARHVGRCAARLLPPAEGRCRCEGSR